MLRNRSVPDTVVIHVLDYPDVGEAVSGLCSAFGVVERLRIDHHRTQLTVPGGGAIVVTESDATTPTGAAHAVHAAHAAPTAQSVMVRVASADAHLLQASQHGVHVVRPPADQPYGERQYTVIDPSGQS